MMFVTVSGNPTEAETEQITSLWQTSLYNANIEITRLTGLTNVMLQIIIYILLWLLLFRFVVSPNRVLIKLNDGSYAYEVKDFLIQQERCEVVTIEGKDYLGKA